MALKDFPISSIVKYVLIFMSLLLLANVISCFGSFVSFLGQFLVLSVISWYLINTIKKYGNKELVSSYKRAVIITGCDTGFGNATALKLNENGFRVYATVLDPECKGAKDLVTGAPFPDMIHVLRMNVTNDGEVSAVYQQIEQQLQENGEELWAVVNNAGVCFNAPLDWGTIGNYQDTFDVNTFGTVRVTRTFLPLIRQSRGHIVNVVSIAGRLSIPYVGAYSMSKHAALSFSDALRRENKRWNIRVSTIEPMAYKTPITTVENFNKGSDKIWGQTSNEVKQEYGQDYYEKWKNTLLQYSEMPFSDISPIITRIVDAVRNPEPDMYYCGAPNISHLIGFKIMSFLPSEFIDFFFSLFYKNLN